MNFIIVIEFNYKLLHELKLKFKSSKLMMLLYELKL